MTKNRLILERNQHLEKGMELSELPVYCSFWPEGSLNPQYVWQLKLKRKIFNLSGLKKQWIGCKVTKATGK